MLLVRSNVRAVRSIALISLSVLCATLLGGCVFDCGDGGGHYHGGHRGGHHHRGRC